MPVGAQPGGVTPGGAGGVPPGGRGALPGAVTPPVAPTYQAPPPPPSPQAGGARGALPWGWIAAVGALALVVCVLGGVLLSGLFNGSDATATPAASAVAPLKTTVAPPPPTALPPVETTEAPAPTAPPPPATTIASSPSSAVEMVLIPAGEFLMGSTDADKDAASDEKPQHKVYLDDYYIDLTEVTNLMYRACVEAGACTPPGKTSSYTRDRYYGNPDYYAYPVIYVDWSQAAAYCKWRGARLPTEAEWEKAARGTDGRIYPWGESIECDRANYGGTYGCVGDTTKVGSYPSGASPYGLLDMAGNVWEWVQDWYLETFYQNTPFENPLGPSSGEYRVLRGGSWYGNDNYLRVAVRYNLNPTGQISSIGFRCGASPAP